MLRPDSSQAGIRDRPEGGLARQTVHNFIAACNRHGPAVLETLGRGQRQRTYLSLAQEQAVLAPFLLLSRLARHFVSQLG